MLSSNPELSNSLLLNDKVERISKLFVGVDNFENSGSVLESQKNIN